MIKAGVRVYLWCQISKGKTKITLESFDSLNEVIITLLYLQKGTTSGVIVLRFEKMLHVLIYLPENDKA